MREEAIRLVRDRETDYDSQWAAICAVATKLGPTPETVRGWVRRDETENGPRPSNSVAVQRRIAELEREVRSLRRDNAILKAASVVFAREIKLELPE